MPGTSAKCEDFGYWCELDTGSHFCVLYVVLAFLLPVWKQEKSVGRSSCSTGV